MRIPWGVKHLLKKNAPEKASGHSGRKSDKNLTFHHELQPKSRFASAVVDFVQSLGCAGALHCHICHWFYLLAFIPYRHRWSTGAWIHWDGAGHHVGNLQSNPECIAVSPQRLVAFQTCVGSFFAALVVRIFLRQQLAMGSRDRVGNSLKPLYACYPPTPSPAGSGSPLSVKPEENMLVKQPTKLQHAQGTRGRFHENQPKWEIPIKNVQPQ